MLDLGVGHGRDSIFFASKIYCCTWNMHVLEIMITAFDSIGGCVSCLDGRYIDWEDYYLMH
jgi:hypothetical protein